MNENENTMYQNLWDATKGVLRGKFIALKVKKPKRSQISDLTYSLKNQKKKDKLHQRKQKKKIKFRVKINEVASRNSEKNR